MKVAIYNCFHWIGYHVTEKCLAEGWDVTGIHPHPNPREEFLMDMIGRNAQFQYKAEVDNVQRERMNYFISIGTPPHSFLGEDKDHVIQIMDELVDDGENEKGYMKLAVPTLVGPWMPLDTLEKRKNENAVVDINDFVNWLFTCIHENTILRSPVRIIGEASERALSLKEGNVIMYRTKTNEEIFRYIEQHKEKFPFYYEL
ncbi:hypothetical protein [Salirhabdus salicampi]|uniref:hypothetical protein n=1 Tax=Salirhabdus salicampi TaxID=476102 RepID=UPI0020C41B2E|nr:hypothetical protein [Salirhabdus salicampi]MCP8615565.1 hypothetical protein [Salirhabdus salicampi]